MVMHCMLHVLTTQLLSTPDAAHSGSDGLQPVQSPAVWVLMHGGYSLKLPYGSCDVTGGSLRVQHRHS